MTAHPALSEPSQTAGTKESGGTFSRRPARGCSCGGTGGVNRIDRADGADDLAFINSFLD